MEYWNSFYEGKPKLSEPSDFAKYVSELLPSNSTIVDCGCGNGRDSIYFATLGMNVIGVDRSSAAIDSCKGAAVAQSSLKLDFHQLDFKDEQDAELFTKTVLRRGQQYNFYARFFIHAIDEVAEQIFLRFIKKNVSTDSQIFLEFRTIQDEKLDKIAPNHYRRFIDPKRFLSRCHELGFKEHEFRQGFGMAKHLTEDPHVARIVLKKVEQSST